MLEEGATIIDIGGESTRPNADEVSEQEELHRVVPVVEAVRNRFDCWISVDSSKAIVMREAANVGMDLINDIRALQEPNALETTVNWLYLFALCICKGNLARCKQILIMKMSCKMYWLFTKTY